MPIRGRGGAHAFVRRGRGSRSIYTSSRVAAPDHEDSEQDEDTLTKDILSNDRDESDDPDSDIDAVPLEKPHQSLLVAFGTNEAVDGKARKRRRLNGQYDDLHRQSDCDSDRYAENTVQEKAATQHNDSEQEDDSVPDGNPVESDNSEGEDAQLQPDVFDVHYARPVEDDLSLRLAAAQKEQWQWSKRPFGKLSTCTYFEPQGLANVEAEKARIAFKSRLSNEAEEITSTAIPFAQAIVEPIMRYKDLLYGNRKPTEADQIREILCLHALNHVYKTRQRVLKNNDRLAKQGDESSVEYRDQGFTRPKVLILLPTKQACVRYVKAMTKICKPEQQENRARFEETYMKDTSMNIDRPADFRELFEGDDDDSFRLGIKFTRKTLKYFAQFYGSDIIIASPLGLRRAIERIDPKTKKKQDYDFLSSIEIVILDQADAFLMQVWDHVEYCFQHLNQQPKESHGCDFSRVRNWYLDGKAAFMRQTVVLSAFLTPELNTLFAKTMRNCFGKVRYSPIYGGVIQEISAGTGLSIRQTFSRFTCLTPMADPDARFKFFEASIVPFITRNPKPPDGAHGILIFIPNYFDFVRVRNFFTSSPLVASLTFGAVTENRGPADPETRRARSHFKSGRHSVLLYTGRAHHFFRYRLKGVKKVIMYALPDNPIFYEEIVGGFLSMSINEGTIASHEAVSRAVISKWDVLKLERIVGTSRVPGLLRGKDGDSFDFM